MSMAYRKKAKSNFKTCLLESRANQIQHWRYGYPYPWLGSSLTPSVCSNIYWLHQLYHPRKDQ
jgi:hypothetical protein